MDGMNFPGTVAVTDDSVPLDIQVRDVDPELAGILLENEHGRGGASRPAVVEDYARQMAAGRWRMNGEAVVVSDQGRLMNGRKRLLACIQAGVPFRALLVFGVPDDVGPTMDTRKTRKLSDILSIGGRAGHKALGAALRHLYYLRSGGWTPARPSSRQLLSVLEANPEVERSFGVVRDSGLRLLPAVMTAVHYLLSQADAAGADAFLARVAAPDDLPRDAAERTLATRIQNVRSGRERVTHREFAAILIKTWNASRRTAPMRSVRLGDKEEFPTVCGLPQGWALDLGQVREQEAAADAPEPWAELLWISPETASEMLERNTRNRAANPDAVDKYARDLEAGRWRTNGETIKFGVSGVLLDGQHRLKAAVKTGKGFFSLVVYDIEESAFDTIDLGEPNGYQDVLGSRGIKAPARVAAGARVVWLLENDRMLAAAPASNSELDEVLSRHPELREAALASFKLNKILPPSVATAMIHLFSRVDREAAAAFFDKLASGIGILSDTDPVHRLRQSMLGVERGDTGRNELPVKVAYTIKAWNAVRAGKPMKHLRWDSGKERFPEISR